MTGLVDLEPAGGGPARLLDVVEGRSGTVVTDWLDQRGPDWCTRVKVAALDPFRGYQRALRAGLPDAVVVMDAVHAVRLAQGAIDDVRRRVQQNTPRAPRPQQRSAPRRFAGSCGAAPSTSPSGPTRVCSPA